MSEAEKKPAAATEATKPADPAAIERLHEALKKFYEENDPPKLGTALDTAKKFVGKEKQLKAAFLKKYNKELVLPKVEPPPATPEQVEALANRIKRYFGHYDKAKVSTANSLAEKYGNKPKVIMAALEKKYGPEADIPKDEEEDEDDDMEAPTLTERLRVFYEKYDNAKIDQAESLGKKYEGGKEKGLFDALRKKYKAVPQSAEEALAEKKKRQKEEGKKDPAAIDLSKAPSLEERIKPFYEKHDPAKLESLQTIVEKYKNSEASLLNAMLKKYKARPQSAMEAAKGLPAGTSLVTPADSGATTPLTTPRMELATPQQTPRGSLPASSSDTTTTGGDLNSENTLLAASTSKLTLDAAPEEGEPDYSSVPGASLLERITVYYKKYDPKKESDVKTLADKYAGKEEALFKAMEKKYKDRPKTAKQVAEEYWEKHPTEKPKPKREAAAKEEAPAETSVPLPPEPDYNSLEAPPLEVRLKKFYEQYEPAKATDASKMASKYAGKEEALFKAFDKKYKARPQTGSQALEGLKSEMKKKWEDDCAAAKAAPLETPTAAPVSNDRQPTAPLSPRTPKGVTVALEQDTPVSAMDEDDLVAPSLEERLKDFYQQHEPAKIEDASKMAQKYAGKEEGLFKAFDKKYKARPLSAAQALDAMKEELRRQRSARKKRSASVRFADEPAPLPALPPKPEEKSSFAERLATYYAENDPTKVKDAASLAEKYAGKEKGLFSTFEKKYKSRPQTEEERKAEYGKELDEWNDLKSQHDARDAQVAASRTAEEEKPAEEAAPVRRRKRAQTVMVQQTDDRTRLLNFLRVHDPARMVEVDTIFLPRIRGESSQKEELEGDQQQQEESEQLVAPPTAESVIVDWKQQYGVDEEPPEYEPTEDDRLALEKRLRAFYVKYIPTKLTEVPRQAEQYLGNGEFDLFQALIAKYGPEPGQPKPKPKPELSTGVQSLPTAQVRQRSRARSVKLDVGDQPSVDDDEAESAVPPPPPEEEDHSPQDQSLYRARLQRFFEKYAEPRLGDIDALLSDHQGREEEMMKELIEEYGEEPADVPLQLPKLAVKDSLSDQHREETPDGGDTQKTEEIAQEGKSDENTYEADQVSANATEEDKDRLRKRLRRFYLKYEERRLAELDILVEKYAGRDDALMAALVKKYGPEPEEQLVHVPDAPTTFIPPTAKDSQGEEEDEDDEDQEEDEVPAEEPEIPPQKKSEGTVADDVPRTEAQAHEDPQVEVEQNTEEPATELSPKRTTVSTTDTNGAEPAPLPPTSSTQEPLGEQPASAAVVAEESSPNEAVDPPKSPNKASVQEETPKKEEHSPVTKEVASSSPAPTSKLRVPKKKKQHSVQSLDYKSRIERLLAKYEPAKLEMVPSLLEKFRGREESLIYTLTTKYGPEPELDEDLSDLEALKAAQAAKEAAGPPKTALELRLEKFYSRYDETKLNNIPTIVKQFSGAQAKQDALINALVAKYGPEPLNPSDAPDGAPFWRIVSDPLPCDLMDSENCTKVRDLISIARLYRYVLYNNVGPSTVIELEAEARTSNMSFAGVSASAASNFPTTTGESSTADPTDLFPKPEFVSLLDNPAPAQPSVQQVMTTLIENKAWTAKEDPKSKRNYFISNSQEPGAKKQTVWKLEPIAEKYIEASHNIRTQGEEREEQERFQLVLQQIAELHELFSGFTAEMREIKEKIEARAEAEHFIQTREVAGGGSAPVETAGKPEEVTEDEAKRIAPRLYELLGGTPNSLDVGLEDAVGFLGSKFGAEPEHTEEHFVELSPSEANARRLAGLPPIFVPDRELLDKYQDYFNTVKVPIDALSLFRTYDLLQVESFFGDLLTEIFGLSLDPPPPEEEEDPTPPPPEEDNSLDDHASKEMEAADSSPVAGAEPVEPNSAPSPSTVSNRPQVPDSQDDEDATKPEKEAASEEEELIRKETKDLIDRLDLEEKAARHSTMSTFNHVSRNQLSRVVEECYISDESPIAPKLAEDLKESLRSMVSQAPEEENLEVIEDIRQLLLDHLLGNDQGPPTGQEEALKPLEDLKATILAGKEEVSRELEQQSQGFAAQRTEAQQQLEAKLQELQRSDKAAPVGETEKQPLQEPEGEDLLEDYNPDGLSHVDLSVLWYLEEQETHERPKIESEEEEARDDLCRQLKRRPYVRHRFDAHLATFASAEGTRAQLQKLEFTGEAEARQKIIYEEYVAGSTLRSELLNEWDSALMLSSLEVSMRGGNASTSLEKAKTIGVSQLYDLLSPAYKAVMNTDRMRPPVTTPRGYSQRTVEEEQQQAPAESQSGSPRGAVPQRLGSSLGLGIGHNVG